MKAIIVEDEELAIQNLLKKLERNCPQVNVIASCQTAEEAIKEISNQNPDLIFLDIDLGSLNGFDVLHRLRHIEFEVIFITNMKEYAVKAFRLDAMDFLEKPIDERELTDAVQKVHKKLKNEERKNPKISIPIKHGARFLSIDEILYCEAANNKTIFHLFNKEEIEACRVLRIIDDHLGQYGFLRIHRSYLANPFYVEKFYRTDGGYVIMSNGKRLPVSRNNFGLFS